MEVEVEVVDVAVYRRGAGGRQQSEWRRDSRDVCRRVGQSIASPWQPQITSDTHRCRASTPPFGHSVLPSTDARTKDSTLRRVRPVHRDGVVVRRAYTASIGKIPFNLLSPPTRALPFFSFGRFHLLYRSSPSTPILLSSLLPLSCIPFGLTRSIFSSVCLLSYPVSTPLSVTTSPSPFFIYVQYSPFSVPMFSTVPPSAVRPSHPLPLVDTVRAAPLLNKL